MAKLLSDFLKDENGHSYRSNKAERVVNTFTVDGSGINTFSPTTTADRVVITNLLASSNVAGTVTLSGSISDPIPFYLRNEGFINVNLNSDAPIIGAAGEEFAVEMTFTGAVSGGSMITMLGYEEDDQSYSG